jgi:hypothetical protein
MPTSPPSDTAPPPATQFQTGARALVNPQNRLNVPQPKLREFDELVYARQRLDPQSRPDLLEAALDRLVGDDEPLARAAWQYLRALMDIGLRIGAYNGTNPYADESSFPSARFRAGRYEEIAGGIDAARSWI